MIKKLLYSPVLSSLLLDRTAGLIVFLAGGIHLGLNLIGLPGWVCPIRAATGIPCPGCGLTTSSVQFLRGDFAGSLETHAFAPVFLLTLLVMVAVLILPVNPRQKLIAFVEQLERRFGVTAGLLFALVVYWGIRLFGLVSFPKTF
ncbi:MAG TPA: DUF2752 domain-containing protein [Anaerolineales bacterium]|nr:DUF2752 domain-containing protein [Anaerolineales bacterium]